MHPIERLRYVARASGLAQSVLVHETARALMSFASQPQELVTACRRMIERQPTSGPLLWLASRVLVAVDPAAELRRSLEEFDMDQTGVQLRDALPAEQTVALVGWPEVAVDVIPARDDIQVLVIDVFGENSSLLQQLRSADIDAVEVPLIGLGTAVAASDLVLLQSSAVGPDACLAVAGSKAAAAVARHSEIPVWLVGGVGRLLPLPLWELLLRQAAPGGSWDADDEILPLDLVTHVVGGDGLESVAAALEGLDFPVAAELLIDDS